MIHPARAVSFEDQHSALEDRVASGALARTEDGPLARYVYSNRCVYEGLWDDVCALARGLVLDRAARSVRATPFPKLFNYGERGVPIPDEPGVRFRSVRILRGPVEGPAVRGGAGALE